MKIVKTTLAICAALTIVACSAPAEDVMEETVTEEEVMTKL